VWLPPRFLLPAIALGLLALTPAFGAPLPTDCHGDPLPAGALARLGTVRFRHTHPVFALAHSPDGKMLAAADGWGTASHRGLRWHGPAEGIIRLWDPATGKELRRLVGHKGIIRRLAFSSDGKVLMSVCDDEAHMWNCTVKLWDPATGRERDLPGLKGIVRGAALSADGTMLAVGSKDLVRLLDVASGKEVRRFQPDDDFEAPAAFSPDGKTLVLMGGGASLWDVATVRRLPDRPRRGSLVAFSPDGKVLATSDYSHPVRLWDPTTGKELRVLGREGDGGNFFAFSPDGKVMVSGRDDGTVLWDVATGKEIRQFGDNRGLQYAGAFSPDGKTLALSDDQAVRLFDVATGKELRPLAAHASDLDVVAFSPDGKTALTGSDGLRTWDAATGKALVTVGSRATVGAAVYAPDGKTIVAGYHRAQAILIRGAATGKELRRFDGQPGEVDFVALLAGSKSVVSMSRHHVRRVGDLWETRTDGGLRVWDLATGKETREVGNPTRKETGYRGVNRAACSADGRVLAVGEHFSDEDRRIRVWDGARDREWAKLDQPGWVLALAFTPDGRRLVSAAFDPPARFPVRLWEVAAGTEVWRQVDADHATIALAVSPDGRVIAAGGSDGAIRLWDLDARKELRKLTGHQGPVLAVAFSPDGRRLISGSRDITALIWDVSGVLPPEDPARLDAGELKDLGVTLAISDAAPALKAVRRLARAPEQALPYIREQLGKLPVGDPDRLAKLVADLDAEDFDKREAAGAELGRLGKLAEDALKRALADKPSTELRLRAEAVLKRLEDYRVPPAELQALRAVEVLELIGTAEARKVIDSLARSTPSARVGEEAKAALDRLTRHQSERSGR
jgi:WD40 repeat protein